MSVTERGKAYKVIGESRQRKAASAAKRSTYNSMKKSERARKSLRKKTWGF
jgi:hypothetical protein